MFKKNTAVTGFPIGNFIKTSNGTVVITGSPTCMRLVDSVGAALTNAASYNSSACMWVTDLTACDMNGDMIGLTFYLANCIPISYSIKTTTKLVSELNDIDSEQSASSVWTYSGSRWITGGSVIATSGSVTAISITDKINYGLSASAVDDVWDESQVGHSTASSFGLYLDTKISESGGSSAGATAQQVWEYTIRTLSASGLNEISEKAASGVWNNTARTVTGGSVVATSGSVVATNVLAISASAINASAIAASSFYAGAFSASAIDGTIFATTAGSKVWDSAIRTLSDKLNFGISGSALGEIGASLVKLGTPVALDGGSATLAGMLVKMADDSAGSSFDATNDSLNRLATKVVTGVPDNLTAISGSLTTGSNISGNYASTYLSNGTYWTTSPSSTVGGYGLNQAIGFTLSSGQKANKVDIRGYYASAANKWVNIYAYNWSSSAWDQLSDSTNRMNNAATNQLYSYNLLPVHLSASSLTTEIGFKSVDTNTGYRLNLDQVLVQVVTAGATVSEIAEAVYYKMRDTVYQSGIWIDTISGCSGTDVGIHGLPTNPVDTIADAITIANKLKVKRFYFKPDSSVIFTQAFENWRFIGKGEIDLNGQNIADSVFELAENISGSSVGHDTNFYDCTISTASLEECTFKDCLFTGSVTLTSSGNYTAFSCADGLPGGLYAPTFIFSPSAALGLRDYHGGVEIDNMISDNSLKIDGQGRLVINTSCSGGDIVVRGNYTVTDNVVGGFVTTGSFADLARWAEDQSVASVTGGLSDQR